MSDLPCVNRKPVNIAAARMLWKSPWWAKAPEEQRQKSSPEIVKMVFKASPPEYADCFKAPPEREKNKIGWYVKNNKSGETAIIIGFHCQNYRHGVFNRGPNKQPNTKSKNHSSWWFLFENGDIGSERDGRWKPIGLPSNIFDGIKECQRMNGITFYNPKTSRFELAPHKK